MYFLLIQYVLILFLLIIIIDDWKKGKALHMTVFIFTQHTVQIASFVKVLVDFQVFQIQERAKEYPCIWMQS